MTRVIMLLDIDWAGSVHRCATEQVSATVDGVQQLYPAGLSLDYEETLDRLDLEAPEIGASFTAAFASSGWAALVAQGHLWSTARGTVRMVVEEAGVLGTPTVLLRGRLKGIEYGDPDQPTGYLRGRVEALASADTSRVVDQASALTLTAWPELSYDGLRDGIGRLPARIIGRPGYVLTGTPYTVPAAPAYAVEWRVGPLIDTLVLSGAPITETSVSVTDGQGHWESFTPSTTTDGAGRLVATVDISGAATISRSIGTEYWWACLSTSGAGSFPLASTRPGLGSVVLALLERSTLEVDHARMAPAVEVLDQIEVGCAVTDPDASYWDVAQELLQLYPCAVRRGPDGIYVVPLVQPARSEDCAHQLRESVLVNREGPVEVIDVEAPSRVELAWAIAQDTGTPSATVLVLTDPTSAGVLVAGAESAIGLTLDPDGAPLRVEAPAVYGEASARRAALAQLLAYPPSQERIELTLPAYMHRVELGQWVSLVSDTLGRTLIGQAIRRRWDGEQGAWIVSLLCDGAPDRDRAVAP